MNWLIVGLILAIGAIGSLVSAFIGDNGWHLPFVDNDVFRPGYLGNMLVGAVAALAAWGSLKATILIGANTTALTLSTSDIANALVIGFGGASWFKSQIEKTILQKAASVAAGKSADPNAARTIATATPMAALKAALGMPAPGGQG